MRVCLAIFRFLFLNSLRLFNFIHACVPLITLTIETRHLFFAVSLICVFRCEKFWPGDEASSDGVSSDGDSSDGDSLTG